MCRLRRTERWELRRPRSSRQCALRSSPILPRLPRPPAFRQFMPAEALAEHLGVKEREARGHVPPSSPPVASLAVVLFP